MRTAARSRPRRAPLGPRTSVAVWMGAAAARLSRLTGRGSGAIVGGRVALAIDPGALRRLTRGRRVVLVSGTNGKTTTTLMVRRALASSGAVASNHEGANMPDGLVAALAREPDASFAALEVDELHLASVVAAADPAVVVLLNLTRDQLDRVGETRRLEAGIRRALTGRPSTTVVGNVDDALVVSAAAHAVRTVWVAAGRSWIQDATVCPRCGGIIVRAGWDWSCRCGLRRPEPDWIVREGRVDRASGESVQLPLGLPGRVNLANAAMALAAATALGAPLHQAVPGVCSVREVSGRYRTVRIGGRAVRLLLAKNPAGWQELLPVIGVSGGTVIVAVNGREADGSDLSWLWDVPFMRLRRRPVIAAGERAADLAVRLTYAGVNHQVVVDPVDAVGAAEPGPIDLVGNYTAFRDVVRRLPGVD